MRIATSTTFVWYISVGIPGYFFVTFSDVIEMLEYLSILGGSATICIFPQWTDGLRPLPPLTMTEMKLLTNTIGQVLL